MSSTYVLVTQVAGRARTEYGNALAGENLDIAEAKDLVTRSIRSYERLHDLPEASIEWTISKDFVEVEE